jgi:sigma54-dependent transcription regulator
MNVPDLEFTVVIHSHTTAGRKWLADRMMRKNDMFSGVVVRSVECANLLGDEAVAAGLRISGLVEAYSFEGPEVDRSRSVR